MTNMMQRTAPRSIAVTSRAKTLIVVPEQDGYPHTIARALALRMRKSGHRVEINDVVGSGAPAPGDYDAVIVGAEVARPRDRRLIGDYIAAHRAALDHIPTGLFLLCGGDALRQIDAFEARLGWRARFAAGFSYASVGLTKRVIRRLLRVVLRHLEGSVADRGVKEVTALADAMVAEVTKA